MFRLFMLIDNINHDLLVIRIDSFQFKLELKLIKHLKPISCFSIKKTSFAHTLASALPGRS